MVLMPSRPSKYLTRGWFVSPVSFLNFGIDVRSSFVRFSNSSNSISGFVALKYLTWAFVKCEISPFFFNFSRMSYVVTLFIFAAFAKPETGAVPVSTAAK